MGAFGQIGMHQGDDRSEPCGDGIVRGRANIARYLRHHRSHLIMRFVLLQSKVVEAATNLVYAIFFWAWKSPF
jgi:hypothetical protein